MKSPRTQFILLALNNASLVLFIAVLAVFGALSPRFFTGPNLVNILIQSASTAIVAIGMTFVLLTAGVDLSVGAIMFLAAAVAGKMVLGGAPLWLALAVILLIGLAFGAVNAFFITRLRLIAFIVTLATLYLGRGFALWFTETRAMNLPPSFLAIGTERWLGIPLPVFILAAAVVVAQVVLARTPFGRQIYAVGHDAEVARKAGVNTGRLLAAVYVISGFCAAVGGILALAQLGAVSPTFGTNKEFAAIAAAGAERHQPVWGPRQGVSWNRAGRLAHSKRRKRPRCPQRRPLSVSAHHQRHHLQRGPDRQHPQRFAVQAGPAENPRGRSLTPPDRASLKTAGALPLSRHGR